MPHLVKKILLLYSDNGDVFQARIIHNLFDATSQDEAERGERQLIETTSSAKLLDGRDLNMIDADTFQIVETGEILKRKR
jgi:hypothetical protein